MTVSLLVVDDHVVFAETLSAALDAVTGIDVVGVASTASDALDKALDSQPDVALVDVGLPDSSGIDVARRLREISPSTRIVILTGSLDVTDFTNAMEAGVSGYLTKQAALPEVADAVSAAYEGRVVVPASVMDRLLAACAPRKGLGSDLTRRELDVLVLLSRGYEAKRAAQTLGVTWHTCRGYIQNVLTKLDAHSALEAVRTATRLKILASDGERA